MAGSSPAMTLRGGETHKQARPTKKVRRSGSSAIKVNKGFKLPVAVEASYIAVEPLPPIRGAAESGKRHVDKLADQLIQRRAAGGLFYSNLDHRRLPDHHIADPRPL